MKTSWFLAVTLAVMLVPIQALGQQPPLPPPPPPPGQSTMVESPLVGTIVLSRPEAIIVKTDDGRYAVFALNRDTTRPKTLPVGARVSVESIVEPGDINRTATSVTLAGAQPPPPPPGTEDVIPPSVRRAEQQIASSVRRYHAGIRAGVGLDPEVITIGAHVTLGPIFNSRLLFRPNVEYAFGELTTLFAINLEAIYRLTTTMPRNQWSPYAGGGPTLGFSHRGVSTVDGSGRSFDFGDFNFNGGLNLLLGIEKPNGPFIELKSTIYTDPHVRLLFGFTF